jgi:ectoine hydroxylase-related dioxygenase (phytanoyl-CoA dioxygenase family)
VTTAFLTSELKDRWNTEGWCVLPELIPPDQLAAAQDAVHRYFPTPAEMLEGGGAESGEWHTWDAAWPQFPFHSTRLNTLVLHERVVDLAEALLGTTDLILYMGLVTAKYANQPSDYNQLLHADYPNHMLVVPRHDVGYQQVEFFIYLTDVADEDGATRFVSWQKTKDIPVERHTLNYLEYAELYDDPSMAAAPAGSVVAYRPDVYHRSVDHTDPTRYRVMLHVSFSHRNATWSGYQAWPIRGFSFELGKYVQQATPRQLELMGVPGPGHPYWNPATLEGMQGRYPGLDMTPWRKAMS